MADDSSYTPDLSLQDDGTINLNDDLPTGSEHSSQLNLGGEYSSTPKSSIQLHRVQDLAQGYGHNHAQSLMLQLMLRRPSDSFASLSNSRRSLDSESVLLTGTFYNAEDEEQKNDEYSPLRPNSIYELTIGSDVARRRRRRMPKTSVTLHGGTTTINNINTPTKKDIPQIQLERLKRKVSNKTIEHKLINDVATEYKKYEQSYKSLTEESLRKLAQVTQDGQLSASSSMENFELLQLQLQQQLQQQEKDGVPLTDIPEVFLDPDLKLDDPRIFNQVLEDSDLKLDEEELIVNDTALQDKLSHYLDLVEVNLVREIEKSSETFFDAIGDIESIRKKSEACVEDYNKLVTSLSLLEQKQAKQGLKVLQKMIERQNAVTLENSVLQLQHVMDIFQKANKSFQTNNYNDCLNEIVAVENLIMGVPFSHVTDETVKRIYPDMHVIDLQSVPALIHLRNDLQVLKTDCFKTYTEEFIELLLNDLRTHYKKVPTSDTLNRMYVNRDKLRKYASKPTNMSYLQVDDSVKQQLKSFVENLIKSGEVTNAYAIYQNRFITEIKEVIKQNLPTSSSAVGADSSQPSVEGTPVPNSNSDGRQQLSTSANPASQPLNAMSANIKVLTPNEFEEMLCQTYAQLSECLRRLTVHQKLLLDIALTSIPPSEDINIMALDITKAIHKAIELTQIRIMKVISVRLEQTADLPAPLYLRLYSITSAYLQECELINPAFSFSGAGNVLSEWFQNHITYFVHRLHVNAFKSMMNSCLKETWKVCDNLKGINQAQSALDEVIGYSDFLQSGGAKGFSGDEWLKYFDFYKDIDNGETDAATEDVPEGTKRNILSIANQEFMVPNLAIVVSNHLKGYAIAAKAFPSFAPTIGSNLLTYFKDLNSKTSQAVLGAGATRSAGLKHITTKHLALCIRFIEFNIALLQGIKCAFPDTRQQDDEDNLSFAKMISNYKDHETELFAKIITIMQDRTVAGCTKLLSIDWSVSIKHPQQCHGYMEDLVRDTTTVAKVLMRYLPELKYSLILLQIFDSYKRLLVESYCTKLPSFKDFNEKHNLLRDIDYFRVKLGDLPGYGNSGQVIWENVNLMPTEEDIQMEEKMRHNADIERKLHEATPTPLPGPSQAPASTTIPAKSRLSFERLVSSARSSFERSPAPVNEVVATEPSMNNGDEFHNNVNDPDNLGNEVKSSNGSNSVTNGSVQPQDDNKKTVETVVNDLKTDAPEVVGGPNPNDKEVTVLFEAEEKVGQENSGEVDHTETNAISKNKEPDNNGVNSSTESLKSLSLEKLLSPVTTSAEVEELIEVEKDDVEPTGLHIDEKTSNLGIDICQNDLKQRESLDKEPTKQTEFKDPNIEVSDGNNIKDSEPIENESTDDKPVEDETVSKESIADKVNGVDFAKFDSTEIEDAGAENEITYNESLGTLDNTEIKQSNVDEASGNELKADTGDVGVVNSEQVAGLPSTTELVVESDVEAKNESSTATHSIDNETLVQNDIASAKSEAEVEQQEQQEQLLLLLLQMSTKGLGHTANNKSKAKNKKKNLRKKKK